MRVTVAFEREDRPGRSFGLTWVSTDPAGTALDLVGIDVGAVRQWRQGAAKLDDISIAVIPLIEQLEILNDLGNRRHDATYIALRTALAKKFAGLTGPRKCL